MELDSTVNPNLRETRAWTAPTLTADGAFMAGRDPDGRAAFLNLWTPNGAMTTDITGPVASGKTRLLELFAAEAFESHRCAPPWIIDIYAGLAAWDVRVPHYVTGSPEDAIRVLRAALAVINYRHSRVAAHGVRFDALAEEMPVMPVIIDDTMVLTGDHMYGEALSALIRTGIMIGRRFNVPFITSGIRAPYMGAARHVNMVSRGRFPGVATIDGLAGMFRADLIDDVDTVISTTPTGWLDDGSAKVAAAVFERA